nr:SPJ_0845 family protein [Streptococcus dysgalactiae]
MNERRSYPWQLPIKKNDELEKMMAGFASLPHFDAPLDISTDGKLVTNNKPNNPTKPSQS